MKLLERFIGWWNAEETVERPKVQAWRGVPADHFSPVKGYVFKDQKNKLVADYASRFAATMTTVSFNTPVVAPYSSGTGVSSLTFNMTSVVSGQPIILCVNNFLVPGGVPGGSVSDTFSTGYTWTASPNNAYNDDQFTWIGTGGAGTSGSITISGMATSGSTVYWGFAVSCVGANTGNYSALVANSTFGENYGSTGNSQSWVSDVVTPTNNAQGLAVLVTSTGGYFGYTLTSGPSSPWVNTIDSSSASCISTYSGPPSGVGQTPQYNFSANANVLITTYLLNPAPSAPNAPTSLTPAASAYFDATQIIPFSATYNSTDGLAQNKYSFRIKVSGGSYNYWNATSGALQSTQVWNTVTTAAGATFTLNLPANILTNGNTYTWAFASEESSSYNYQGPFSSDTTLYTLAAPTVAITAPTSTITTNQPTFTWTRSLNSGTTQSSYRVVVESGGYGTTPGLGTSQYDSGVVSSSSTSLLCPTPLPTLTLRVFILIVDSHGESSLWAYGNFTVLPDLPATPTGSVSLTTDPTSGLPEVELTVQAQDNYLTANQSSFESGTTGWSATLNCTISQSATYGLDGNHSLLMTSSASGRMDAATLSGTSGVPVTPGTTYTALASFRAGATSRTCYAIIYWFNSSGTSIGNNQGIGIADTTTGWTQASVTATAPAGAAFAQVVTSVQNPSASNELHYVDRVGFFPSAVITNLLPAPNDSFENGVGAWQDAYNAVVATSTSKSLVGSSSLAISSISVSNGAMIATTQPGGTNPTGPGPAPVTAGQTYTLVASFLAATTSRKPEIAIYWFNSSGTLISSSATASAFDNTSTWTQIALTATAPTGAVTAGVFIDIGDANGSYPATGETHYVDCVALQLGASTVWSAGVPFWTVGGFLGYTSLVVLRSDGQYVRGASPTNPAAIPASSQSVTIIDAEAPSNIAVSYYVFVVSTANSQVVTSEQLTLGPITLVVTKWWFWTPGAPSLAVAVNLASKITATLASGGDAVIEFDQDEDQGVFTPFGRSDTLVVHGDLRGEYFSLGLVFTSDTQWAAFNALRTTQKTIAIRTALGLAVYYMTMGTARPVLVIRGDMQQSGGPNRQATIAFLPSTRPAP